MGPERASHQANICANGHFDVRNITFTINCHQERFWAVSLFHVLKAVSEDFEWSENSLACFGLCFDNEAGMHLSRPLFDMEYHICDMII